MPGNGKTFKSSRVRTKNHRSHLANTLHVHKFNVGIVKEVTHYARRIGHGVPCAVAVLCKCIRG